MIAKAPETHDHAGPGRVASSSARVRRSSVLRWPGWVFVVTSLFLAIGAFNGQNNLLFFTFGLSVCAILLSGVVGGSALLGVRVHRLATRPVAVGGSGAIRYTVSNRNRLLPVFGVLIEELYETGEGPADGRVECPPALIVSARARETVRARSTLRGVRTGVVRLRGLRIRSSLPFGLIEKRIEFPMAGEIEVHPAVLPVRRPRVRNAGRLRTPVAAPSRQAGGDDEFLGVREFVHGDSSRKIAWARSAAHDSLVVRTNARPRPETFWISLDPRAETRRDRELTLSVAASLAADRVQQGVAVGIEVPEWGVLLLPRGGREHLARILSMLARQAGPAAPEHGVRSGERVHVSARSTEDDARGAGSIDARDVESWLSARGQLPESMRPEPPREPALERMKRFFGSSGSVESGTAGGAP